MRTHARVFLVLAALVSATFSGITPASADPCPDVEVVYARGTDEPPGVGKIGQSFIDALRADAVGKTVGAYAVNYPAIKYWPTAAQGIADASAHIMDIATNCPNTRLVLAGYSQGASVISLVTDDWLPPMFAPPNGSQGPLPPFVADHVASIALFGMPAPGWLTTVGAPPIAPGVRYANKVINMCLPDDPVCSANGNNGAAHTAYADNGMTMQAASIAAQRLYR